MKYGYSIRDVAEGVCQGFKVTMDDLRNPNRARHIARPRQVAMFLAREMTSYSYPQIGTFFCRHHTTILSGQRRIAAMISQPERDGLREAVQASRNIIEHRGPSAGQIRQIVANDSGLAQAAQDAATREAEAERRKADHRERSMRGQVVAAVAAAEREAA